MSDSKREEVLQSAVKFLQDPKVQSAALAKKVAFLESKGLTSEEIEEAMARASGKIPMATAAPATGAVITYPPGTAVMATPPPLPTRPRYDWRDVFIATIMAGGVGYGIWILAKKYLEPFLSLPTQKDLEIDKQKLDDQFATVEEAIKQIQLQTTEALTKVTDQSAKASDVIENVGRNLDELKASDAKRDDEFKAMKSEVDSIKEMIPKMMDRNRDSQTTILNDLQQEIKSLKALLVNRRPNASTTSSAPSTPIDSMTTPNIGLSTRFMNNATPGIPAWQMKPSNSNTITTNATTKEEDSIMELKKDDDE